MYLHITSKLASSLVFSSALLFGDYHSLIGRWVSKLGFLMWKIFPRISICSNFCLLRMSALPPERSHKKAENREKEAPTFREQLFSHKLPFCPYKQKLLVRQNLKELSYSGKTIAFKHLNIINVYLISAAKRLSNNWLFNFINQSSFLIPNIPFVRLCVVLYSFLNSKEFLNIKSVRFEFLNFWISNFPIPENFWKSNLSDSTESLIPLTTLLIQIFFRQDFLIFFWKKKIPSLKRINLSQNTQVCNWIQNVSVIKGILAVDACLWSWVKNCLRQMRTTIIRMNRPINLFLFTLSRK